MDIEYFCFVFLGTGLLLPWNAFITAADFYSLRFPGKHMDRSITVAYLPVNLCTLACLVHFHSRVPPRYRMEGGFWIFLICILQMPLLNSLSAGPGMMGATLTLVAFCGLADGVAQGALFGEAARLQPEHTQALVLGTALSGVAVSLLRIITKAALPDTPEGLNASANLYFGVAAIMCAACIAVLRKIVIPRMQAIDQVKALQHADFATPHLPASNVEVELSLDAHPDEVAYHYQQQQQQLGSFRSSESSLLHHHDTDAAPPTLSYRDVLPVVKEYAASLVLVYSITLSIFPGVLAEDVTSERLGSWYPVGLLAAFNIADACGKWLPSLPALQLHDGRKILFCAALRVVFLPVFYFVASHGAGVAAMGILTLLLGCSNGFLTAVAMMAAPLKVEAAASELCGNITVLALVLGLCIGAGCGFLWLL